MEELRQEFLNDAVFSLEILQKDLQARTEEQLSGVFLQELFRRLHTIKGTAQTFDFKTSGSLAHEIENLLQALRDNKISQNAEICLAIEDAIELLLETLRNEQGQKENIYPQDFVEKIRSLNPNSTSEPPAKRFSEEIPENLLTLLSSREKDNLLAALHTGKNFFLIDVGFDFSNFDEKFKEFRELLINHGEIIATASSPNVDMTQQIGFQIFFTSKIEVIEMKRLNEPFKASLSFTSKADNQPHSNNLPGILAQIIENADKTARTLGKQINFQIFSDEIIVTPKSLRIVYEILLHLTRNAVDHAIEAPEERLAAQKDTHGKIEIAVSNNENKIFLRVEDDGRGINIEEIIKRARQKEMVSDEKVLSEQEALELIFSYGLSTSETISEISGRGVGLDVVKEVVDKTGGEIKIQTIPGRGTIFEVYLPNS